MQQKQGAEGTYKSQFCILHVLMKKIFSTSFLSIIFFKITFDKIMPLAVKLMDLETVILSEISHTEKAKYSMASVIREI